MFKNIYQYFADKSKSFKLLMGLFALAFTKSIFIFPFTLIPGMLGLALGILLCIAVYLLCVIVLYFLSRISWEYKKTAVKRRRILLYMAPQLLFNAFLLVTFFPGKMSYDSMYIWYTTVTGEYTNLHPITYTLFVDLLNNIVNSPWLVIAVQFTYTSFVFAYTGYVFEAMGLNRKLCWAIVLLLMLYPVNFHQNVTMLKDVPYMISLVLISAIMLKIITDGKLCFGELAVLFAVSLIAVFSRHNGALTVPVGLAIFILYFLVIKNKKAALKIAALLAAVVVCFLSVNRIAETTLKGRYWQRLNTSDILMMPSAQCSYTISKHRGEMTQEMNAQIDRFFDVGYIYYQMATYPNWEFNNRPLETLKATEIMSNKKDFAKLYLELFRMYPHDMLLEYQQITGIIWAIPNYGYTVYKNVGITEYNGPFEIAYTPLFPKFAAFLDRNVKIVFWLRPALWLMLSILLLFALSKGQRIRSLCLIAPMIANAAMFFAGTPAQNTRYFYCNFSIFLILLVFTLMKKKGQASGKQQSSCAC